MNGETTVVAVTLVVTVVLIVSSITVFISGMVIGYCLIKRMKTQSQEKLDMRQVPEHGGPAHVYEDIQSERQPEMKQNVAYSQIKDMTLYYDFIFVFTYVLFRLGIGCLPCYWDL